jgi:hypothetical protein
MLKRREECDTYLTCLYMLLEQRQPSEKIKYIELSSGFRSRSRQKKISLEVLIIFVLFLQL